MCSPPTRDRWPTLIATTFGVDEDGVDLARRYLEKIVQIPVRVPSLGRSDTEAYIAQLLLWHRVGDADQYEALRHRCAALRSSGSASLIIDAADGIEGGDVDVNLAERLAPILYEELDGNPRRIKRLLNALWIRSAIAGRRGLTLDTSALAKLVVLEEVFPKEFPTLLGWLSAGTLDERLDQLESGEGDFTASLRRWGTLEPRLAPLGVGSYLVLAAALLGTVVSLDALPPHLRDVADDLTSQTAKNRRAGQRQLSSGDLAIGDRSTLATHVGDAIRFQPSRQADLAESLSAIVDHNNEVASAAADALRKMPPGDVDAALVIAIAPPGSETLTSFAALMATWADASSLRPETRNAIALANGDA